MDGWMDYDFIVLLGVIIYHVLLVILESGVGVVVHWDKI